MNLSTLEDAELLRRAYSEQDPLTSTPLEAELLRRFELRVDEAEEAGKVLAVLSEFDIDDPARLKAVLQRDAQLRDVLDDLADPLARLNRLAQPETAEGAH